MSSQVATWTAVVYQFQQVAGQPGFLAGNWGTGMYEQGKNPWQVNEETYINGVPLIVDGDYWMGYLLEVVDRTAGTVSYGVVTLFHGGKYEDWGDGEGEWTYLHDSMQYEPDCGTFFERTEAADQKVVGRWAVSKIYDLADSFFESRAR